MWQKKFEKYKDQGFTVIGIALDAEGIEPAKRYYEKYHVTFPALVDPNYASEMSFVPVTIFVDEHGVVQSRRRWEENLKPLADLKPVTEKIRKQWSSPGKRFDPASIAKLVGANRNRPQDLATVSELASRYLDLNLHKEARKILEKAVTSFSPKEIASSEDKTKSKLLGQVYFQLSRACKGDRKLQVKHATMSYYLYPSVGFGKQIARIIAPEKFDGRPKGDFDNAFREATLRRLKKERREWLKDSQ